MVGECNNLYYAVNVDNDSLPAEGEVDAEEVVREVGRVFTVTTVNVS